MADPPRLISLAIRTGHFVGLVMLRLIIFLALKTGRSLGNVHGKCQDLIHNPKSVTSRDMVWGKHFRSDMTGFAKILRWPVNLVQVNMFTIYVLCLHLL